MRYKEGERGRQTVYMRHVYKEPRDLYVDMGVGGREREMCIIRSQEACQSLRRSGELQMIAGDSLCASR